MKRYIKNVAHNVTFIDQRHFIAMEIREYCARDFKR